MRFAFASLCLTLMSVAPARADDASATSGTAEPQALDVPADTVPVLIKAGANYVSLGPAQCDRGWCIGRVERGTQRLERRRIKDGNLVTDFLADVTITQPSVVRVSEPGALRAAALATLVTGAAVTLVGLFGPFLICRSSSNVDPASGSVFSNNPCDGISDPVKIGWIGGIGVGITLWLVGAVASAATDRPPRAYVAPWNATGIASRQPTPRVTLAPFVELHPARAEGGIPWGRIGLRAEF